MTFDLVDDFGLPLGTYDNFEVALLALRGRVGDSVRRSYDFAILVFDDDRRIGGPITLDPDDLGGAPIRHPGNAPAPPQVAA